jgi:transmembrane sensor
MKNYHHFSAEDFFWDEAFRNWVLRPTREDDAMWQQWLIENPQQAEVVFQARELVHALHPEIAPLPPAEKERAISRIMGQFDEQAGTGEKQARQLFFAGSRWLMAACSLLLLVGLSWIFLHDNGQPINYDRLVSSAETHLQEVRNTGKTSLHVALSDGSSAILDPGSKISFPEDFAAAKREVYLSGGAFFDITKNPDRPFYVYADEVVTKVLGTSFHVRSFTNEKEVSVAVKTGRVAVFTRETEQPGDISPVSERSGVVIEPNQQIIVARKTAKMTRTLVSDPEPVLAGATLTNYNFDDYPVSEIFKTLQNAYGISIIFDENIMKDCPVTATLTALSLYEKLDLVCNAVGASYEVIDGRIIINGKGCGAM